MSRHQGENVVRACLVSSVVPYMLKDDSNPDGVPADEFEGIKSGIRDDRSGFLKEFGKGFYGQGTDVGGVSDDVLEDTHRLAMLASEEATLACVDAFGQTTSGRIWQRSRSRRWSSMEPAMPSCRSPPVGRRPRNRSRTRD